jgi:hypothetical protein
VNICDIRKPIRKPALRWISPTKPLLHLFELMGLSASTVAAAYIRKAFPRQQTGGQWAAFSESNLWKFAIAR